MEIQIRSKIGKSYKQGRNFVIDMRCDRCGLVGPVRLIGEQPRSNRCPRCSPNRMVHGQAKSGGTKTYRCWQSILDRCNNPACKGYENYGGRGIKVCARWTESFANFLEDMGESPDDLSIGRADNDGDYEPHNCHWETRQEQNSNTRQNMFLTYSGRTQTATEWARELCLNAYSLRQRIRRGMDVKLAIETPFDDLAASRRANGSSRTIRFKGITATIQQWSERTGIGRTTIQERLKAGWSVKRALTTPPYRPSD